MEMKQPITHGSNALKEIHQLTLNLREPLPLTSTASGYIFSPRSLLDQLLKYIMFSWRALN